MMKETEVILCDEDREFASRLIVFLRRQEKTLFSMHYYGTYEEMAGDRPLGDHLLIGKEQYEKLCAKGDPSVYAGKVHILVSERTEENAKGSIYKYQSAKEILRRLTGESKGKDATLPDALIADRKSRLKEECVAACNLQ